ncbi:hypothetical protein CQY20_26990 [Mycolicibacterium agri]|uniref:Uncharacterized protein n=1 Tax=Mycolicibacterium agri TaxID=36811 RepID=A0A2A7MSM7_MYCAG|nr:DUF6236 family protein [Mycolicibacterium agri]PEG34148.1 hypothetical protein CQY20_26990 [Mycolicibacterium agri]GFG53707.1 hypothetical protein MAGR_51480 [Mycolicibacterium agri]
MQKPALYFPFVHIRNDEWLKAAALYWPSVRRLVPDGYAKRDTLTEQVFAEAGVLQDEAPGDLLAMSTWHLGQALSENADVLVDQFGVERARGCWDGKRWADAGGPDWELPALGWIHVDKFPHGVAEALSDKGLAVRGLRQKENWMGLHPTLASAYMTALAAQLSAECHFEPLTDQTDLRIASPSTDIRSALSLLLGQSTEVDKRGLDTGVATYLMVALQQVCPANLESIPAETILRCRTSLAEELNAFRDYVSAQQTELAELAAIRHDRRRVEAFADHVKCTVEPRLRRLEKALELHKLQPTRSLLLAQSLAPPAIAGGGLAAAGASPTVSAATGIAVAIGVAWWEVGAVRTAAKADEPVAFLLSMRDELTPRTLKARIRKFLRGTYGSTKERSLLDKHG